MTGLWAAGVWVAIGVALVSACGGGSEASPVETEEPVSQVTPFVNVAPMALVDGHEVWNDRPGVAIFDYDRDGDLDLYVTAEAEHANWLYRNEGDGTFSNVARSAGVMAVDSHSTGAVACDLDNDGYQDLYVGAWGSRIDGLDFRSPSEEQGNRDSLFRNNGDGTFEDITAAAFGDAVNVRSAASAACADVDGDGLLDIYVANVGADDFRTFDSPGHPGHYNMLYRNLGEMTFEEIGESAGVRGEQISMRDHAGLPITFEDPETGERFEGYDPTRTDRLGNRVGEPTGQTHAALFFDYDDDGDPDLWIANDGDRLHLYRNDTADGIVRFTSVAKPMGIDQVGSWMGFAVGDVDGDADLDVFATNIGYHPLLRKPPLEPVGVCSYHHRFAWGTCSHALLRNDGPNGVGGDEVRGFFVDVAPSTRVVPSPILPPEALDPSEIHSLFEVPTGLQAYDFGFGATFFDYDNDGDQDLYWLGSTVARGEALGGDAFPGAGTDAGGRRARRVRGHHGAGAPAGHRPGEVRGAVYERAVAGGPEDQQAVSREREGSGARGPERRRLRGPGGVEQQRAEAVRRRHDGHSGSGVRVAERGRFQPLADAAAAGADGRGRDGEQRGRRGGAGVRDDESAGAGVAAGAGAGGAGGFELPVDGQRGPGVRAGRVGGGGQDRDPVAERAGAVADGRGGGPGAGGGGAGGRGIGGCPSP